MFPQYTPEPANPFGYIYLMRCQQFFKIGKSTAPRDRLRNVQSHNPYRVKLVRTFQTTDMDAAEGFLHRKLRAYHEHGEWFLLPKDSIAWLLSIEEIDLIASEEPPTDTDSKAPKAIAPTQRDIIDVSEPPKDLVIRWNGQSIAIEPPVTPLELQCVYRTIQYRVLGISTGQAIARGFQIGKSGTDPRWKRATTLLHMAIAACTIE